MNELEDFIVDLSLIDKEPIENDIKAEKIAEYILNGPGWNILNQIDDNKININSIFADKFIDLIFQYCSKLLLNLSNHSKFSLKSNQLENSTNNESGTLLKFINICFNLYIKFNDGLINNIFTSNNLVIIKFSDILFNHKLNLDNEIVNYLKFIYLKFLHKNFKINFENVGKKSQNLPSGNSVVQNLFKSNVKMNTLFQEQFKTLEKSLDISTDLKIFYTNLIVNYIYEFAMITGFSKSQNTSHQINSLNSSIFKNLIELFNLVSDFLFENLSIFELDDFSSIWKHLSQLILELKDYKNKLEHSQTCLRSKHTTQICKKSLNYLNPKHNDFTCLEKKCIFKKISQHLFKLLNRKEKSNYLLGLIDNFGICSCTNLHEFIEWQKLEDDCYYNEALNTVVIDYLFLILRSPKSENSNEGSNKRRSIFFPLLVDTSLVEPDKKHNTNEQLNENLFKDLNEILIEMDSKSVTLSKYLAGLLKKYSKYVTSNNDDKEIEILEENSFSRSFMFKYMICEILYIFTDMLKLLKESDINEKRIHLFEIITTYIKDFLVLTSSIAEICFTDEDLVSNSSTEYFTNSKQILEMKTNKKFLDFMSKYSIIIYDLITDLCYKYELSLLSSISICAQLLLHKNDMNSESNEKHLCKCLMDTIDSHPNLLYNHLIINILLELFVKSTRFRVLLNDWQHFHLNLLNCLKKYFKSKSLSNENEIENCLNQSEEDLKYIEVLLDLLFCYFYYNRKKDLNEIYTAMKDQLDKSATYLTVYFNVMIMSKAFQLNKVLNLNNPNKLMHTDSIGHVDEENGSKSSKNKFKSENLEASELVWNTLAGLNEYDADAELSVLEHVNESNGSNRYKYDLILFPRILDICLNYITHVKRQQRLELIGKINNSEDMACFEKKYHLFNTTTEVFFKKLIYLLESSNFNVQIILNNNFRHYFIEMIQKRIFKENFVNEMTNYYKMEQQLTQNCLEILFHLCAYDMNESFLMHLFEQMINNEYDEIILESKNINDSKAKFLTMTLKLKEMNSNLLLRLSENLNLVHSTNYLHLPYQSNQEPIDFLLQTNISSKKWKVNLNYTSNNEKKNDSNSDTNHEPHLNRIIKESSHKIYHFRIPIKCTQTTIPMKEFSQNFQEIIYHSYSLAFMLRFDDNLINYSKSNGLDNSNKLNHDSYVHLLSVNLDNELSCFELWLNPNGNLLFIRRSDQSIIITFNLLQIQPHLWYLIYVNYEEEQRMDKINCKISFSINAKEIIEKDFEIYNRHDKPILKHSKSVQTQFLSDNQKNLYLYIGHHEKKPEISHFFKYDLGQVILSKDSNYTNEHLILLMQIMDTNFSLIDQTSSYEWGYLNGYCDIKILENIEKNFNEYCDQIKSRIVVVYHPRYPHTAAVKINSQKYLSNIDLSNSCKSHTQSTLDICLAKIGGIQQVLVLIAKLIDQEHKLFTKLNSIDLNLINNKLFDKPSSLLMLETLINLINKRANIQSEFKQMDGYILLQRIFISIVSLNKYTILNQPIANQDNYYSRIQKALFVILINGCFFKPVFSVNYYLSNSENIEFSYGIKSEKKIDIDKKLSSISDAEILRPSSIYVINPQVLSQIIIEWELWAPLDKTESGNSKKPTCLYKYAFQVLNRLLDYENKSQVYHSNLFLKFNLLEKLINFLLDANTENYILDQVACTALINIFKHFNSIFSASSGGSNSSNNSVTITKQLFSNFFDFLYILHPENNVYIVNQKNEFYFNLNLSLLSIPFAKSQLSAKHQNLLVYINKKKEYNMTKESFTETSENEEEIKRLSISDSSPKTNSPSLKGQIIDSSISTDNEHNFSRISTTLMKIMTDMLSVLPDLMVNDILNLLKFESFIMFAMDDNEDKRFEAFNLFLELIERSSTMSFFLTSVASAAGNVVGNVTNTTGSLSNQQNLGVNKEFLIYSMANQLSKYDQIDVRFIELCISKLINQPFNFNRVLDSTTLKSQSNQISSRQSYIFLLVSLIYSSKKNVDLCRTGLKFLSELLSNEIIRVDFLISQAGLLQVMINLLKFFSDHTNLSQILNNQKQTRSNLTIDFCANLPIVNELRNFFCLVARFLLKFNENQDPKLFNYFVNSIIHLCYNSANTEHEQLHYNLKSIVLNIIQPVMSDLNSITIAQDAPKSSMFLKKIIAPLIMSKPDAQQIIQNQNFANFTSNLFDSDEIFQKFLIFVVDFLHIVYDKISDYPIVDTAYDINDELSLFSFSILTHSFSIAFENNLKGKFATLFRTNLTTIRLQFRRLFLFLLHPNHKLQTRLQIIKHLLNTPNCETITKFILSRSENNQSSIAFNSKLSFYLNTLITNNLTRSELLSVSSQAMANNDKEVLAHFNQILNNSGLNYKNEMNSFQSLNNQSNETIFSEPSSQTESSYLLVNYAQRRGTIDLKTQLDKELDEEILKIYKKSVPVVNSFCEKYDRLAHDLNGFACNLTNQVVLLHSSVRKMYYQRLKNKFIKTYDIKQKWILSIENMTHEKCLWFDGHSWPQFEILDQTEGPNRERRRLKKSHLFIEDRFFKDEFKNKLNNEKCSSSLKYLLNNYEDYLSLSQSDKKDSFGMDSTFTTNYMLSHWKNSEIICYPCPCKSVMPYCEINGQLLLTDTRINFAADEKNYRYLMGMENVSYSWSYDDIKEIHLRRYLLKDIGIEIFLIFGQTILLAFSDIKDRNDIYRLITSRRLKNLIKTESFDEVTALWKDCKISNYEYLMQLNKYSGRTFNDLMQYPIYPHVLANYSSEILDLSLKENFRDLSKPIAVQYKEREEKFLENYRMLQEASNEPYHYASLYSNSGTVLHYLVRLPPFTKMFLDYQDKNFDVPDRTFHSMQTSWLLSSRVSTTDYKELIPEFYFLHEFLTNRQGFHFGVRQNGDDIDNVVLPPWSKTNPRLFIIIMRQALESNHVTLNLNNWIDLIWGYKQSGRAALDAINCYHPACYFGYPVEQITDPVDRKAIETMIKTWGQTPKQLFQSNHPYSSLNFKRQTSLATTSNSESIWYTLSKDSIHNLVLNVKWGSYVGSLEQQAPPVCVWKENCKKNIVSLNSLVTNDVIGLTQHKCLLLERAKEGGMKNTENFAGAVIEWGSYDDYIKIRYETDKPASNLIPIRGNEHSVACCNCIGSNYIVVGMRSGLVSVFKLKKEKSLIMYDSFACNLYGHRQEITDINVCLSFSTMITSSQDGLLIVWDTNKLSYVNSINIKNQLIYKVCISETTNEIAFIGNTPNKLYFYTGNCDHIGEKDALCDSLDQNENIFMKSLCFSNQTEGLNVNVIAVGLSNGKIRLYSTWDLTMLRELVINYDSNTIIGSIIGLTFTRDGKRLYVSDTYARVYILEPANSQAAMAKFQQSQLLTSINSILSTITVTTPNYSSNLVYFS